MCVVAVTEQLVNAVATLVLLMYRSEGPTLQVAKRELKLECDYRYEARCQMRFVQLIADDEDFRAVMHVPAVIPELCSASVLCSEWVPGVHIDKVRCQPMLRTRKPLSSKGPVLTVVCIDEAVNVRYLTILGFFDGFQACRKNMPSRHVQCRSFCLLCSAAYWNLLLRI